VIRSRETAADHSEKNASTLTHRAAARAAKKLRVAKHAAKLAALAAAKSADPAPKVATPAPQTAEPAPKAAAPAPKTSIPPAKKPGKALVAPANPSAAQPNPAPAKPQATPAKPAPPPVKQNAQPVAAKRADPKTVAPPTGAASGNGAKPAAPRVNIRTEHSPSVDSTQTMRALTPLELADDQASKWFVIQLALSEDDFDPEHIPHLDIFEAYRLYSVIGIDQGRIMHALRLGFFSDEISAQAVTGYIKSHFEAASVKRVSVAERERFAERQVAARKDIGATGMHAIIEMASPTPVPETRLADLRASTGQGQPEEKSLWSRLVSPLKRQ
jgi:hypothetical protein